MKEKQIEEIRKDIFAAFGGYAKWEEDWQSLAEAVCDAGYRKQSDVARKIFEEIEREITDALKSNYKVLPQVEESEALWNNVNGKINALSGIGYFIAELKKKYTGEV